MKYNIGKVIFFWFFLGSVSAQNVFDLSRRVDKQLPSGNSEVLSLDSNTENQPKENTLLLDQEVSPDEEGPEEIRAREDAILTAASTPQVGRASNDNMRLQDSLNPFHQAQRSEKAANARRKNLISERRSDRQSTNTPEEETHTQGSTSSALDAKMADDPADASDSSADSRVTEVFSAEGLGIEATSHKDFNRESQKVLLFWLLLFVSLVCSITVYLERDLVFGLFRALNNSNFLNLLHRKRNQNANITYSVLYAVFMVNLGVFLYLMWQYFYGFHPSIYIAYFILAVAVLYAAKHLLLYGLGWVYRLDKVTRNYSFTMMVFNSVFGLVLLPLNYFMAFGSIYILYHLSIVGLAIGVVLLLIRSLRVLLVAVPSLGGLNFQFLLYLCTVELMPLGMIWQYLS